MTDEKLIAWSHSRVDHFLRCGFKMLHMFIKKTIPFEETKYTLEGKKVHKLLEERVRDSKPLPPEYAYLEQMCAQIVAAPGDTFCEVNLALDKDFKPCGYKDWQRAWVRVIIDVLKINGRSAWAGDYKTGVPNNDEYQLMLTAAVLFEMFPQVDKVTTTYLWTKIGRIDSADMRTYHRHEKLVLWQKLLPRYAELQKANRTGEWPKRPSPDVCKWCELNKLGMCDVPAVKYKGK